jgi:hypothetical protein
MKNLLIFLFIFFTYHEVSAQQYFHFRYFPVPDKVCTCSDSVINQYQQTILEAIDEAVLNRKRIRPPQEKNQVFLQQVSRQIKKTSTESSALKKAAIEEYRKKIEVMHFRLATADEKEKPRLKKKIDKKLERYCKKYSARQTNMLRKHIKEMAQMRPWFSEMEKTQNDYLPNEKNLTVADFDLYFLYLENLGKVYGFKMQTSERSSE